MNINKQVDNIFLCKKASSFIIEKYILVDLFFILQTDLSTSAFYNMLSFVSMISFDIIQISLFLLNISCNLSHDNSNIILADIKYLQFLYLFLYLLSQKLILVFKISIVRKLVFLHFLSSLSFIHQSLIYYYLCLYPSFISLLFLSAFLLFYSLLLF